MNFINFLFGKKQKELPKIERDYSYKWITIEEGQIIQEYGLYVFECKGDNHLLYEVFEMFPMQPICYYFNNEYAHLDGWATVKPIRFYYIPLDIDKRG